MPTIYHSSIPIIGIFHDMGETQALKGYFFKLREIDVPFKIFLTGAAYAQSQLLVNEGFLEESELITPKSLAMKSSTLPTEDWAASKSLEQEDLQKVVKAIEGLKPQIILSGCVSNIQSQVLQNSFNCKKISFYDNFKSPIDANPRSEIVKACMLASDTILSPSSPLEKEAKSLYPEKIHATVGHSQLESMPLQIQQVDSSAAKDRLNIKEGKVITFIGGYDHDGSYERAFSHFMDELSQLKDTTPLTLVVQLHPRQWNKANEELIEYRFLPDLPNIEVIFSGGDNRASLSTPEALAISNLALSFDSTVTLQAALAGKISAHFAPTGALPPNICVEKGVIKHFSTHTDILEALNKPLTSGNSEQLRTELGIPQNSIHAITELVSELLSTKEG